MPPTLAANRLNNLIDCKTILSRYGSRVNKVPDITTCPLCKNKTMWVMVHDNGGNWYHCNTAGCQFSGDSFQLAARHDNITLRNAIPAVLGDKMSMVSKPVIERYLDINEAKHIPIYQYWADCQVDIVRGLGATQIGQDLIRKFRMYKQVGRPGWARRLGQHIGMTKLGSLRKIMPDQHAPLGEAERIMLNTPLYGMPGNISGYAVFDVFGDKYRAKACRLPWMESCGVAFMNVLNVYNDDVYVIGPLAMALAMQIWAYQSHSDSLPIVSAGDETTTAWKHIHARRYILWDPEDSRRLFSTAKRIGKNVCIATRPATHPVDPFKLMENHSASFMLNKMETSCVPWITALKDKLVSKNEEYGHNMELLAHLELSADQRFDLIQACVDDDERLIIKDYVESNEAPVTVMLDSNRKLIERDNGWHCVIRAGQESLILDAIPVVTHRVTFPDGTAVFKGYIRHGSRAINFVVDTETLKKVGEEAWITSTVAANGEGDYPFIHTPIFLKNKIFAYSMRLHKPEQVSGINKIGWDDNSSSFVFPKFAINYHGRFEEANCLVSDNHPAISMKMPVDVPMGALHRWVKQCSTSTSYWAAMSCVVGNMIAKALGKPTFGAAVLYNYSGMGQLILDKIKEECRLESVDLISKADYSNLRLREVAHNIPLIVETDQARLGITEKWLRNSDDKHCLKMIDRDFAVAMSLHPNWVYLTLPEASPDLDKMGGTEVVLPHLLAYFLKLNRKVRPYTASHSDPVLSPEAGILGRDDHHIVYLAVSLIEQWFNSMGVANEHLFLAVRRLIQTHSITGESDMGHRLLNMVFYNMHKERLSLHEGRSMRCTSNSAIFIANGAKEVFINRGRVYSVLQRHQLPHDFNNNKITAGFLSSDALVREEVGISASGWILKLKYWKSYYKQWRLYYDKHKPDR